MGVINSFSGEYRFLSNFWPCIIIYEGITYPSTEHAFQAAKSPHVDERIRISVLSSPGAAKKAGRNLKVIRPDWNEVRLQVMEDLCRLKFMGGELRKKLLATGEHELVEGNTWNDTFWGVCNGQGKNNLGKILMKIRESLR